MNHQVEIYSILIKEIQQLKERLDKLEKQDIPNNIITDISYDNNQLKITIFDKTISETLHKYINLESSCDLENHIINNNPEINPEINPNNN